ncbi:hypothetical protein TEGL_30760 [Terrisporobacter glycolicus ATCC 14880 = DSM 1288]|uniref:Uncharacterized protein n=1 Tax=Terrisporobacter glycolicus ATCC 14880 = DSM 1288 TaxID=1121315 RepID=A0ABZ2EY90_9FIRM
MKRKNYKKSAMILGISCLLLFTVGVSYSKVMGNII